MIAKGYQMVVFDQNQVIEAETVVGTSTTTHGIFFPMPPPWGGFPRIQKDGPSALKAVDVGSGESRHTAEALKKIECDAFCAEEGTRESMHPENGRAGVDMGAVGDETIALKSGRTPVKSSLGKEQTGDHGGLAGANLSG